MLQGAEITRIAHELALSPDLEKIQRFTRDTLSRPWRGTRDDVVELIGWLESIRSNINSMGLEILKERIRERIRELREVVGFDGFNGSNED